MQVACQAGTLGRLAVQEGECGDKLFFLFQLLHLPFGKFTLPAVEAMAVEKQPEDKQEDERARHSHYYIEAPFLFERGYLLLFLFGFIHDLHL